ncbi:peptidase inhibitor family I36 protein [Streptomyces sp. NPDC093225]|uniref:peptidase inhibitor family I36 protein n=1 Tax=Streptomyces sp. NPDC093225 TaxID=3366034 RepID=UPI00382EC3C3
MKQSRLFASTAATLLALTAGLAATPAAAADCPSGNFCAWTDVDFGGQRANWSGDDTWWESWIADEDSSWANHGISGPGIKDHVQVYRRSGLGGGMSLCLAPGQEVNHDAAANDDGDSHTWSMNC